MVSCKFAVGLSFFLLVSLILVGSFPFLPFTSVDPVSNPTSDRSLACGFGFQCLHGCMFFFSVQGFQDVFIIFSTQVSSGLRVTVIVTFEGPSVSFLERGRDINSHLLLFEAVLPSAEEVSAEKCYDGNEVTDYTTGYYINTRGPEEHTATQPLKIALASDWLKVTSCDLHLL